jgi:dihydrolipoamide dehydrogenase
VTDRLDPKLTRNVLCVESEESMPERFDLTVVGGGPGGYVAAIRAAQLGLKVVLVERDRLGGVCLNEGCIPTKALLASAHVFESIKRAGEYGISVGDPSVDLSAVFERKDAIVARLRGGVEKLLKKRDIVVVKGEGALLKPGVVRVIEAGSERLLESSSVILATGSTPIVPPAFGYDGKRVITSTEALSMVDLPENLIVIGTGAIGCEFAGFYSAMGVEVVLLEMLPEILPGEDASAVRLLKRALKKRGVDIRTGVRVESLTPGDTRVRAELSEGEPIEAAVAILAMGRRPAVENSWIVESGIKIESGAVVVNDRMETSLEGVYAIGDLVGGWLLAHVASREGIVAASCAAGRDLSMDYRAVPRCTFTHPEIASVGITEAEAAEQGLEVDVGRFPFAALGKALADGETTGFVKVIAESGSGRVVGGVVVGANASVLVHEIGIAIANDLSAEDIAAVIRAHPTLSESVMEAAEAALGVSIHTI